MSMYYNALRVHQLFSEWNKKLDFLERAKTVVEPPIEHNVIDTFLNTDDIWTDGKAMLETNQFYALSIVGPQGSGKTSIAQQFAQLAEDEGFKIIYALPDDFVSDVQGWSDRTLEPHNDKTCIILDDLSYALDMSSRKNQSLMKNIVARLRHIYQGQIFVIFITHRLHATPPMLRNSGSWIFTNMQSADRDDSIEVIGKSKEIKERLESIYQFIAKATIDGARDGNIIFTLGGKEVKFRWGKKDNPGDGRLMSIYHTGDLKIFNSRMDKVSIDLHNYRYSPPLEIEN